MRSVVGGHLNELRLEVLPVDVEYNHAYPDDLQVVPFIDGRSLYELAHDVEVPFAMQEGGAGIPGRYVGLPTSLLLPRSRHLLGQPVDEWPSDEEGEPPKTVLGGCICGTTGCWPLLAMITVTPDKVIWSDFENPHMAPGGNPDGSDPKVILKYDRLGPFQFDRASYENALEQLRR